MASDVVQLCNLALGRVKGGIIDDIDEGSKESIECKRLYEDRRDTLLRSYAWRFARTTKALTLKAGEESGEWLHVYDYPNDCLKANYILPPEHGKSIVTSTGIATPRVEYDAIPFEVMSGTDGSMRIHTDYDTAHLNYTRKVEDVRLMDPLFTDAFGWFMAIDLAVPVGGDSAKKYKDDAIKGFDRSIDMATTVSANEAEKGRQKIPRAIQARHGGSDRDYHYNGRYYRRY